MLDSIGTQSVTGGVKNGGHMSKKLQALTASERDCQEKTYDHQDAMEYLQTAPIKLLVAAASGKIDMNEVVKLELANRGLDLQGNWVGFK